MWSLLVIFLDPRFGLFPHLVQSLKHIHVEHCLAIAAIESFNKAVLHWFAWFDELECHAMLLGPFSQSHRHQLTELKAKARQPTLSLVVSLIVLLCSHSTVATLGDEVLLTVLVDRLLAIACRSRNDA